MNTQDRQEEYSFTGGPVISERDAELLIPALEALLSKIHIAKIEQNPITGQVKIVSNAEARRQRDPLYDPITDSVLSQEEWRRKGFVLRLVPINRGGR